MPARSTKTTEGFVVLTSEEIRGAIDVEARQRLHMSGAEFLEQWKRHELPDTAASWDIGILAGMLYLNGTPSR